MKPPRLNRKLTLQEAQRSADGAGGFALVWVDLGSIWAAISAGTGRERAGESLTVSTVPYRITVRGAPEGAPTRPKPEQRFVEGGRVFLITAVAEADPDGHYLTCFANEEVLS
ncbi:MAG: head-tail adaptor protein [Paracoccaceae bacterium]